VTRLVAVPVLALLVISACGSKDECSGGDRCSGNTMQTCGPSGPLEVGPNTWTSIGHCDSPQVCRVNAIGPNPEPNAPSQSGCFNPNTYCLDGIVQCEETVAGPTLWSCVLRTSDQTVQWSRTICRPPTTCIAILTGAVGGCYEVVRSCPAYDTQFARPTPPGRRTARASSCKATRTTITRSYSWSTPLPALPPNSLRRTATPRLHPLHRVRPMRVHAMLGLIRLGGHQPSGLCGSLTGPPQLVKNRMNVDAASDRRHPSQQIHSESADTGLRTFNPKAG
jgi:hypothetical protein